MRVLLLIGATLFSLMVAELGLRLAFSPNQFLDRTSNAYRASDFDRQSQTVNSDSTAVDTEADTVFDPDLGWRMRPDYYDGEVRHDSRGFREIGLAGPADSNSLVLTIGDSFTYGLGVPDSETFSAVLSRETNRQVINAGVNAYGVDQALLMWELEGKKTLPDRVILGLFVDDFFRNALSIRDRPKPCFVYDESAQTFRFQPLDLEGHKSSNQATGTGSHIRLIDADTWLYRELEVRLFPDFDEGLQAKAKLSRFLLKRLDDSVKASGAELLIVIIGNCFDQSPNYRWIESSIEKICEAGVPRVHQRRSLNAVERVEPRFWTELSLAARGPRIRRGQDQSRTRFVSLGLVMNGPLSFQLQKFKRGLILSPSCKRATMISHPSLHTMVS